MGTKHFILIAGNCGSGKTYLAKLLQKKYGGIIIDDPKSLSCLDEIPDDIDLIYITDPYFCLTSVRELAEEKIWGLFPGDGIAWLYFENDVVQCRKNVTSRDDGRYVKPSVSRFAAQCSFPANAPLLPCYKDEQSFLAMVEGIIL